MEYRSCHWPGGSAGSPQCVRPMGCWFFRVPRPPYVFAVSWATWLLFTGVPVWYVALRVRCPGPLGSCSPVCPLRGLCRVCGVLGHLAPVHRCARSVCCFACAVSWATWLLFPSVPAWFVVLCVRCPSRLAPVHRCARSVCCVVCAVSRATWLLFTGAPARCVALRLPCPEPLASRSPVCPLGVFYCVCGVLGHLAPVHRCARSLRYVVCAVSWATWLLFTSVPARCVVWRVRCPGPLGSCSPVCPGVCCFACAVSWATWLPFTGVPARCVVLCVRCPGPLRSCSPVCPRGVLCCVCGVMCHLAPVHRCARSVCCFACAVSWATWLLFTSVAARCVVLRVRCPGPLGSCSPLCPLGVLFCVCGVLGLLAPVHRCARSVCCVACAVSWPTWLLFIGVPARCVVLRVPCPGPLGSCSPVPPGVCCFACAVSWATWLLFTAVPARCVVLRVRCPGPLGSCSPVCPGVCCFPCAVSWATWLLFTGVPAPCVVLRVRCPRSLGSCSPVCPRGVLCCVCGVLGHFSPVHRCARSVCCLACAVSWATWLLFTGVLARCVVLRVRCPGPLGSCSPVCPRGVLCCVCGVLGHYAPVHRCARSVRCSACAVFWASWLPFTGVPARCVVLCVRCPGPLGSCSPVCPLAGLCCVCGVLGPLAPVHRCSCSVCCLACAVSWATWLLFTGVPGGVLFRVCGVLGHVAPVHRCACSVCCVACAVSWATWLLFTGVSARCVVLRVRCPGPFGSSSPVCPLGVVFRVCGILGHLAPVHRCARSLCCVACAVSRTTWLLFTGVPARCVVLRVRCPGPPGSCSPVCPLGVLCCVCGVLGHLAPLHRCARSVCCVACAVSWATWLLFTGVPALCVGGVCGVLGHLAPVHRCACLVYCVARAVSWAPWLLFTAVPARWVVLCVRFPGPLGSCSPVCSLCVLCFGLRVVCCCAGRRCGALTRPSGRRLFAAGRGWVPSGRALVHPDGGCS